MKKTLLLITLLFGLLSAVSAQELQRRSVVGTVAMLTLDDLSNTMGLSKDEARYQVRVQIEGVNNIVLGFGDPRTDLSEMDKAKLALLTTAMERRQTVSLRLGSVVTAGTVPNHAAILAVSVKP